MPPRPAAAPTPSASPAARPGLSRRWWSNTSQHLNIVGGFATCPQGTSDNSYTTLDGTGGTFAPVLRMTVGAGGIVKLRHLTIRGGDAVVANNNYGGGIYFRGEGLLEVIESTISNNTAHYGGGHLC